MFIGLKNIDSFWKFYLPILFYTTQLLAVDIKLMHLRNQIEFTTQFTFTRDNTDESLICGLKKIKSIGALGVYGFYNY